VVSLVAFSFSANTVWSLAKKDATLPYKPATTQTPATTSIAYADKGMEQLELSGRLTQDSTNYSDSIDWIVKSSEGEMLFNGASQILSLPLKPGTYKIEARYGNLAFEDEITLPEAKSVSVNFVLNAGALRIAPRLPNDAIPNRPSIIRIYAMGGPQAGQLVRGESMPGEIIKLAAGMYRVETGFPQGNVKATTEVEVKAGIIRAVDVTIHAGVAEFPALTDGMTWTVGDSAGEKINLTADESELVLKPGAYVAEAKQGNRVISKSFIVQDGTSLNLNIE